MDGMTQPTQHNQCGACKLFFDDEGEVFSHECQGIAAQVADMQRAFDAKFETRKSNFGGGTTTLPRTNAFVAPTGRPTPRSAPDGPKMMTQKQSDFIRKLLAEREGQMAAENIRATLNMHRERRTLSSLIASDAISKLLSLPKGVCTVQQAELDLAQKQNDKGVVSGGGTPTIPQSTVLAGRYALVGADSITKFYSVDTPTEGRWAGRTFVSVWASDEKHPIRNAEVRSQIIAEIAKDPKEALLRFGREIGKCGRCGRTLTDQTSREYGLGPVCKAKEGW